MAFRKFLTTRGVVALAAAATVGVSLAATLPATATPSAPKPVFQGAHYLALGDSVSFGYREASNLPTPNYNKPATFTGFPELVAKDLGLKVTNASCPGETSASLVSVARQSNGCLTQPDGSPGYRAAFPLHVSYQKSQLNFAVNFLKAHPNTRLVTLMVGANDGFLCQETTADHCTNPQELLKVLTKVANNVGFILERLRQGAGYTGQIVVVNYYSLDYSDPTQTQQSTALNQAVDSAAQPFNVRVANGFQLFKNAAKQAGGSTCSAGLLTVLQNQPTPCGVHPSLGGQALLASAVERNTIKS
jgi:lysophospholipase L1-like esterase